MRTRLRRPSLLTKFSVLGLLVIVALGLGIGSSSSSGSSAVRCLTPCGSPTC